MPDLFCLENRNKAVSSCHGDFNSTNTASLPLPWIPDNMKGIVPSQCQCKQRTVYFHPIFIQCPREGSINRWQSIKMAPETKHWHNYLFFNYLFIPKNGDADRHSEMYYLPICRNWMTESFSDRSGFLLTLFLFI